MLEIIFIILIGLVAGSIVNALADDLPYRRNPGLPTYPDGTPRPISAWSGIVAFALKQREPANPQPDEKRKRGDDQKRLSWRYPLTELMTIGLMLLALHALQQDPAMNRLLESDPTTRGIQFGLWLVYMAIMALIVVIDMEHKLILFVVIIPSALLALLDALLIPYPSPSIQDALVGAAVGFGVFFLLYRGGFLFTYIMGRARGTPINTVAFGYGDVMMITLSGLLLGLSYTVLALFITVFLGAIGAFLYLFIRTLLIGNGYSMFTALPYGPYIVAATVIMLLYGQQVRVAMLGY